MQMNTENVKDINLLEEDLFLLNADLRDLMKAVLSRGENFRFRAHGWSMSPFIKPGDQLIITPINGNLLKLGQVVAFIHPGSNLCIVHRVIRRKGQDILIKGDNINNRDDGWTPKENILGTVNKVLRNGKRIRVGVNYGLAIIAVLSRYYALSPIISIAATLFGKNK